MPSAMPSLSALSAATRSCSARMRSSSGLAQARPSSSRGCWRTDSSPTRTPLSLATCRLAASSPAGRQANTACRAPGARRSARSTVALPGYSVTWVMREPVGWATAGQASSRLGSQSRVYLDMVLSCRADGTRIVPRPFGRLLRFIEWPSSCLCAEGPSCSTHGQQNSIVSDRCGCSRLASGQVGTAARNRATQPRSAA